MAERGRAGHPWGLHRVLDRAPRLPQAAQRLDNRLPIYPNEILISVERLNIDAASFLQMERQTGRNPTSIGKLVLQNTRRLGKQHNRVTGSGGMLIGRVSQIGSQYRGPCRFRVGDRVATLVSLTLTPLYLDSILEVDLKTHQLAAKGHAILFESAFAARLPSDIPENVAMAIFDVAGAPATMNAICRKGQRVVVIGGGGKAGVLSIVAARNKLGRGGRIYAIEPHGPSARDLRRLNVCDAVWEIDATDPVAVASRVARVTHGKMADVVINVASVPNTELSAILSAGKRAKVLLFSMATSFTQATLGAEGVASQATLLLGNGFFPGHDRFAIRLLRQSPVVLDFFVRRYGN